MPNRKQRKAKQQERDRIQEEKRLSEMTPLERKFENIDIDEVVCKILKKFRRPMSFNDLFIEVHMIASDLPRELAEVSVDSFKEEIPRPIFEQCLSKIMQSSNQFWEDRLSVMNQEIPDYNILHPLYLHLSMHRETTPIEKALHIWDIDIDDIKIEKELSPFLNFYFHLRKNTSHHDRPLIPNIIELRIWLYFWKIVPYNTQKKFIRNGNYDGVFIELDDIIFLEDGTNESFEQHLRLVLPPLREYLAGNVFGQENIQNDLEHLANFNLCPEAELESKVSDCQMRFEDMVRYTYKDNGLPLEEGSIPLLIYKMMKQRIDELQQVGIAENFEIKLLKKCMTNYEAGCSKLRKPSMAIHASRLLANPSLRKLDESESPSSEPLEEVEEEKENEERTEEKAYDEFESWPIERLVNDNLKDKKIALPPDDDEFPVPPEVPLPKAQLQPDARANRVSLEARIPSPEFLIFEDDESEDSNSVMMSASNFENEQPMPKRESGIPAWEQAEEARAGRRSESEVSIMSLDVGENSNSALSNELGRRAQKSSSSRSDPFEFGDLTPLPHAEPVEIEDTEEVPPPENKPLLFWVDDGTPHDDHLDNLHCPEQIPTFGAFASNLKSQFPEVNKASLFDPFSKPPENSTGSPKILSQFPKSSIEKLFPTIFPPPEAASMMQLPSHIVPAVDPPLNLFESQSSEPQGESRTLPLSGGPGNSTSSSAEAQRAAQETQPASLSKPQQRVEPSPLEVISEVESAIFEEQRSALDDEGEAEQTELNEDDGELLLSRSALQGKQQESDDDDWVDEKRPKAKPSKNWEIAIRFRNWKIEMRRHGGSTPMKKPDAPKLIRTRHIQLMKSPATGQTQVQTRDIIPEVPPSSPKQTFIDVVKRSWNRSYSMGSFDRIKEQLDQFWEVHFKHDPFFADLCSARMKRFKEQVRSFQKDNRVVQSFYSIRKELKDIIAWAEA